MRERIEKRIEELKAARASLAQALAESRQRCAQLEVSIHQHDGALAMLDEVLKAEETPPATEPVPDGDVAKAGNA